MVAYGGSGIINYRIDTTKKTKFDVILRRCGPNRVNVIRLIKELTGLGLIESKELIDNAPKSIKEGVLRNRFREQENIVLFRPEKDESDMGGHGIAGGWVKDPVVGMNQWVATFDFASLYPTTQRQFFISPENFIGIQNPKNPDYCDNGLKIDKSNTVILVNGAVFEKRNSPTIRMLEDVYADRKKNKKIMMQKKEELKKVLDEIEALEGEI